jgi:CheY-like chemotaxis protein
MGLELVALLRLVRGTLPDLAAKHADIRSILEELIEHLERDAPASKELPRARRVLDRLDNLVGEWTPDAGLVDWVLPVLDGGSLTRAIKADPALARIFVIIASARGEGDAREGFETEPTILVKPIDAGAAGPLATD